MRVCKHGCVKLHVNTPPPDFQNESFDWSVNNCHCQINVVGRYVLISKMFFFLKSFLAFYFLEHVIL